MIPLQSQSSTPPKSVVSKQPKPKRINLFTRNAPIVPENDISNGVPLSRQSYAPDPKRTKSKPTRSSRPRTRIDPETYPLLSQSPITASETIPNTSSHPITHGSTTVVPLPYRSSATTIQKASKEQPVNTIDATAIYPGDIIIDSDDKSLSV